MPTGPSKVGTQTTTTDSTPWNSSYLTGLYDNAKNAYSTEPTLYQDPSVKDTYNKYLWSGDTIDKTIRPESYGAWNNAISGGLGVTNSPVYWDEYNLGKGQTNTQLGLDNTTDTLNGYGSSASGSGNTYASKLGDLASMAPSITDQYQNTLKDTASGKYLNANPYLDNTYNAAADAVTRNYQTATAPQADSKYELAGRYGSGALANATHQNNLDLGDSLNKLASDIYGKNYATERGYMNDAATSGGKLALQGIDTGITGYTDAGKTANAGYDTATNALKAGGALDLGNLASQYQGLNDLKTGYEAGNKNVLQGLALTGDVAKAQTYGLDTSLTGAQGLQTYGQAATDAPWTALNRYSGLLGNSTIANTETSKPIYGPNTATSLLGTGSSLLNLGNGLSTAAGSDGFLGKLFGLLG